MLELHTFRAAFGQPTATPFGVKAYILLKMAGVEFEVVHQDDPRKAPKGKFPVLIDSGEMIADSTFIRRHLEGKHGADFDAGLSSEQRAQSLAFQRLAEEHFYWTLMAARWANDAVWPAFRDRAFVAIPGFIRPFLAGQVRKQVQRDMRGHGMGRHSLDEAMQMGRENLAAISDWLGDKPFMHGETPTAVDASVGAFVANAHDDDFGTGLPELTRAHDNLGAYADRIRARFYPDG